MKIKIFLLLILLPTQVFICVAQDQDTKNVNQNIINSVEKSMIDFLNKIPNDILINYNIKGVSEIKKASIGNPIEIYNILNDTLVFTNTWRVPLIIKKEYRGLFTVVIDTAEKYKIVDYGASLLAETIFTANKTNKIEGLLRVYKLRKDFIICDNNKSKSEFKFIPTQNLKSEEIVLSEIINMLSNK